MQILCAVDFSAPSARAAEVAADLARKLGLPLRLVHSVSDWPLTAEAVPDLPQIEAWREHLEAEAGRLRASGLEVSTELRQGPAARELVASAAERPTRLLILGSTGRGLAERWLLGSVAERVAEGAPVPTLVVRDPEALQAWLSGSGILRVLCGFDFSLASDAALVAVKELIGVDRSEVEAVHLGEAKEGRVTSLRAGEAGPEHAESSADADLGCDVWERVRHVLGRAPTRVHVARVARQSDHELARLAEARGAGLVVVGTRQLHGWRRLSSASFSRGVLAHAPTNVLCVPLPAAGAAFEVPGWRRVLVATDFSDPGHAGIQHAFGLLPSGGEIRLIHVVAAPEPGISPLMRSTAYLQDSIEAEKTRALAQGRMEALAAGLPSVAGVRVTTGVIVHESAAAAICEAAEKFGADVVCVGSRGCSSAEAVVLGSVAHSVIGRCRRPVLVVPPVRL